MLEETEAIAEIISENQNNWHMKITPEIRVFMYDAATNKKQEIERYMCSSVPRVGDFFSYQHWDCEITGVRWSPVKGRVMVTVYCDGTTAFEAMKKQY